MFSHTDFHLHSSIYITAISWFSSLTLALSSSLSDSNVSRYVSCLASNYIYADSRSCNISLITAIWICSCIPSSKRPYIIWSLPFAVLLFFLVIFVFSASSEIFPCVEMFRYYGNKYYVKGFNFNLVGMFQPEIHE